LRAVKTEDQGKGRGRRRREEKEKRFNITAGEGRVDRRHSCGGKSEVQVEPNDGEHVTELDLGIVSEVWRARVDFVLMSVWSIGNCVIHSILHT
jgi:hypothetical protein